MSRIRSLRGLASTAAIAGLLVVVVLFVVLPALASTPGTPVPPPSTSGVTPIDVATGGQSNDCAVFYASNPGDQPLYQYRIANPKSQKYTTTVNGSPVSFTLLLNPPDAVGQPANTGNKYVDLVTSSGAKIVDIGIKGGLDETRYRYGLTTDGFITADGALHAPAQSTTTDNTPTQLYSISNLTFCFGMSGVSGSVYNDVNQDSDNDSGDTPLSGWTVRLYRGVTAGTAGGGTLTASTTSAADGSYRIGVTFDTSLTYRVCEVPPSGTWAQSEPLPSSTTLCSGTGEKGKGYDITPPPANTMQVVSGRDFGNVAAVAAPCPAAPFGTADSSYLIQLSACKTNQFVFDSGSEGGKPFASVWTGDTSQAPIPLIERITWPYDASAGQNQDELIYNDTFPFTGVKKTMQYCLVDPRTGPTSYTLAPAYSTHASSSLVLPAGETSCLVTTIESANDTYVAWVYSEVDGWRSTA
jgi:hypothetical protein